MPDFSTMSVVISIATTFCGSACFLIFLLQMIGAAKAAAHKDVKEAIDASAGPVANLAPGASAKDLAELLQALAALTDSLVKAGPALWTLIGSVLFFLIAALSVGLLSAPQSVSCAPPIKTSALSTGQSNAAANKQLPASENMNVH